MLGADILSKEERDRTSEFLFVKPVSRDSVVTSKLLAALANIVIFNLVTLVLSIFIVGNYSHGENLTGEILKLMLGMFVLQLIYMAVGLGIAAISRKPKSATGVATGILLVTFLLSIVIQMDEKLDVLKFLTPFKYFEAKDILSTNGAEPAFIIISISLIILLLSVTYLAFRRRDLKV